MTRIRTHHRVDEPLEGVREESGWFVALMDCPKLSEPIVPDLPIDLVVDPRTEERNGASIHDEQDDTGREDVDLQSIINSSLYLRSPITISPNLICIHLSRFLFRVPEI